LKYVVVQNQVIADLRCELLMEAVVRVSRAQEKLPQRMPETIPAASVSGLVVV
jgi:hypothetical protein